MANKDYKAFVVEGEAREPQILDQLCRIYFKHSNFKIITLPAGENIYMLWKKLREDDFETDLIEVLRERNKELEKSLAGLSREDFSEIYLFFDYDGHQNNLSPDSCTDDVVNEMLANFDNETENGKLYISYPMVEALRDFTPGICGDGADCRCRLEEFGHYKQRSADGRIYTDFREYTFEVWRELLNVFIMRISCLFGEEDVITYDKYYDLVNPHTVYICQKCYLIEGCVLVLSAFPEFLLDYFPRKFWKSCVAIHGSRMRTCGISRKNTIQG